MDEEDIEFFNEDIRKIDKIENFVMEIGGVLVHVYKQAISPAFQGLLHHFGTTLFSLQGKKDYEILNAVCFFCDVIEYGGDDLFSVTADKAGEKFIECIQTFPEDRSLIQSAGYGLGAIAKRSPNGHFSHLAKTLQVF